MKALEGLKILDFTTLLPGPYATLVLADLGAEVLKVSSPSKQDIVLEYEPFVEGTDIAANEAWLGRNKRNIFLNLKHPKAIAIVKQLIQEYDIVIEQFRPGVMEKLGLGYEALKAVNPALIYCSLTGYGQTGPMAKAAGHDCNYLARSGNLAMAGYRDAGPAPMNIQIADICVGSMNSVVGILAAVVADDERARRVGVAARGHGLFLEDTGGGVDDAGEVVRREVLADDGAPAVGAEVNVSHGMPPGWA